jgi:hypothetical protein
MMDGQQYFDTYKQYKAGTYKAIEWLTRHAGVENQRPQRQRKAVQAAAHISCN